MKNCLRIVRQGQQVVTHITRLKLSEVRKAMRELPNGKSPGFDQIPAELIKVSGEEGEFMMHKLCCKVWNTKQWPEDWRRAVFITLPKKDDLLDCNNYRTISLISHASKILLKIINRRMENKLEMEINDTQSGFRKGKGTRDQVFALRIIRITEIQRIQCQHKWNLLVFCGLRQSIR